MKTITTKEILFGIFAVLVVFILGFIRGIHVAGEYDLLIGGLVGVLAVILITIVAISEVVRKSRNDICRRYRNTIRKIKSLLREIAELKQDKSKIQDHEELDEHGNKIVHLGKKRLEDSIKEKEIQVEELIKQDFSNPIIVEGNLPPYDHRGRRELRRIISMDPSGKPDPNKVFQVVLSRYDKWNHTGWILVIVAILVLSLDAYIQSGGLTYIIAIPVIIAWVLGFAVSYLGALGLELGAEHALYRDGD
jgi:uncharacterized membrane protein